MRWSLGLSLLVVPPLLAGCGSDTGGRPEEDRTTAAPTATATDTATSAPGALVLRAITVGGIAGVGGPGSMPDVSVYGDGRAIAKGDTWPAEYRLTTRAYDKLITDAREAGLAHPRTIDDPHIADALYTVITFAAGRTPATTKAIQGDGRGAAADFAASRLDPAKWPAGDLASGATPYRPTKVAVLALESPTGGSAKDWPFGALEPGVAVAAQTCTELTGDDIAKAQRLADRETQAWRHQGKVYRVTFRPLLPDEPGCAALARP